MLTWSPAGNESKRRALPAYCPDLVARFAKETSLAKSVLDLVVYKRAFSAFINVSLYFLANKKLKRVFTFINAAKRTFIDN